MACTARPPETIGRFSLHAQMVELVSPVNKVWVLSCWFVGDWAAGSGILPQLPRDVLQQDLVDCLVAGGARRVPAPRTSRSRTRRESGWFPARLAQHGPAPGGGSFDVPLGGVREVDLVVGHCLQGLQLGPLFVSQFRHILLRTWSFPFGLTCGC